jgi:hypothetical protein
LRAQPLAARFTGVDEAARAYWPGYKPGESIQRFASACMRSRAISENGLAFFGVGQVSFDRALNDARVDLVER